ncbi:MAG TPA: ADP-ribosyltransferase [Natronosporangium sp.]|nr:ADP-ribosyltransferase [Natronosporangium sp.]
MSDPNPLIAERVDSTTWSSGLWMLESIEDARSGIASGSWVDASLGVGGAALSGLGFVVDPVGSLVSMGVAWLIEHVKPLSDALDWLAGDPDQIAAYAQTWANVATRAIESGEELAASVAREVADWADRAAEAYRVHVEQRVAALGGIGEAAAGIGEAVRGSGELVAAVRMIVRDLIAECVAVLAARLPTWLAEIAGTLGFATPVVVAQVASLVAKWAARISRFLSALLESLGRLFPLLAKLMDALSQLRAVLRGGGRLADDAPVARLADDAPTGGGGPDAPGGLIDGPGGGALTDADRAALTDYTGDGYRDMNSYLRNPNQYTATEQAALQARADRVSEALARLPPQPGTTYRGADLPDDVLARYQPGQVVTEQAFTSTSRDPSVPQGAFDGNTLFTVIGQNGRDVAPYSQYAHEAEILYDRGTNFMVTSRTWDPDLQKWIIVMEEVP